MMWVIWVKMGKMGNRSVIGDMDDRGETELTCREASAFKELVIACRWTLLTVSYKTDFGI